MSDIVEVVLQLSCEVAHLAEKQMSDFCEGTITGEGIEASFGARISVAASDRTSLKKVFA